jgi:ElaB/YqjD/DUF883 family membrane-anchored ribosome-binding protein
MYAARREGDPLTIDSTRVRSTRRTAMANANATMMEKGLSTARTVPEDAAIRDAGIAGTVEQVREKAAGVYHQVKTRAMEKEAEFEGYVKEHPVKSVLVAAGVGAGVGLVLGVLLARR